MRTPNVTTVLVIEDNKMDFLLAQKALKKHTQETVLIQASTLREAKEQIKSFDFDLILVDLHLSDADGTSIITEIKKMTSSPVVVLTGRDEDDTIRDSIEKGAYTYLHKGEMNGNLRRALLVSTTAHQVKQQKRQNILNEFHKYFLPQTHNVATI